MKIGVIGTGNIGGTLARKLTTAGHQVRVANSKGPGDVRPFADEIGAEAVDTHGAVDGVELVILATPLSAIAKFPKTLFENTPQTTPIVSTSNYYPELGDPRIPDIDAGQVESVWVSEQLGRPVLKAFNSILAYSLAELGRPRGAENLLAMAQHEVKPVIDRVYPFAEYSEAYQRLASGRHVGKVVIDLTHN